MTSLLFFSLGMNLVNNQEDPSSLLSNDHEQTELNDNNLSKLNRKVFTKITFVFKIHQQQHGIKFVML